jgi:hypothetical protein
MSDIDQTRQQAQDLLVHVEELLADVNDPATAREAVVRLTSVVALLNGTEERERQRIDPIAVLAGALSTNAIAAVLADLEGSDQPNAKHQAVQDQIFRALEEQLARLEGDDAAERLD